MTSTTEQGWVQSKIEEGIATITFYHPSHNSLPGELLKQLVSHIDECGHNPAVGVIILKSEGERSFCAGASFDELAAIDNLEKGKAFFMGFANVINACRRCPKIILGRIQGKAVGGGIGIASASDYCYATERAAIRLSELAVGIGPFVVGPAIERKMGSSVFQQLALQPATWYDATWCRDKGLYHEVLADIPAMDEAILAHARQLLGYNPEARAALKKIFWEGADHWDQLLAERAAISGQLVLSDFTKEAIARFKQERA
jgi:methylglutaconyl-CoA hydratase